MIYLSAGNSYLGYGIPTQESGYIRFITPETASVVDISWIYMYHIILPEMQIPFNQPQRSKSGFQIN
jgi:hypothetical protein